MRRYVREGKFAYSKVGKRYLIPASEVEAFLQRELVTPERKKAPKKTK